MNQPQNYLLLIRPLAIDELGKLNVPIEQILKLQNI